MVWVIAGVWVTIIMVTAGVIASAVVNMPRPRGEPEAAQPEAGEPVHITTVEDVLAWGERMRAEIVAWAQKKDPSPSPPESAEAGRDPPATARSPREARLASGKTARSAPWRAGLSVATVQKALRPLKAEGLVVGSPGYAMFVAER
jgi:hypothetical protein